MAWTYEDPSSFAVKTYLQSASVLPVFCRVDAIRTVPGNHAIELTASRRLPQQAWVSLRRPDMYPESCVTCKCSFQNFLDRGTPIDVHVLSSSSAGSARASNFHGSRAFSFYRHVSPTCPRKWLEPRTQTNKLSFHRPTYLAYHLSRPTYLTSASRPMSSICLSSSMPAMSRGSMHNTGWQHDS